VVSRAISLLDVVKLEGGLTTINEEVKLGREGEEKRG